MTPDERAEYDAGIEAFKAMLPQPAPVVPVEMNSDKAWGELKISAEDCQAWSEGWNACRAAMLQAEPVTTANKLGNSPVIPDTWIPVSERMPEDGEHVIVFHPRDGVMQITFFFAYGKWWDAAEDDGGLAKSYFTHWMPLPAAPQEVK